MAVLQIPRMTVTLADFPENYCWKGAKKFANDFVKRLIITPNQDFSTFVYGSVKPSSDEGPWFNTAMNEWWVWDDVLGDYRPEKSSAITGEVPIGTIVDWVGTIADIPAFFGGRWMHMDGSAISRTVNATLFGICGTIYGAGDGVTTFNIPNIKNMMRVCASTDNAGTAKSSIWDPLGVALLKSRAYTQHRHSVETLAAPTPDDRWLSAAAIGNNSRISPEVILVDGTPPYSSADDIKIIPDSMAFPAVLRVS